MKTNELKKKLLNGEVVTGSFVYIPSAKLAEIVGLIGFDFAVIDMEHGPIDTVVAEDMVRAVENLDDLLSVDGIDVYYLGPQDLSNSLGIPGQSKDLRVVELVEDSIRRISGAGKVAGCIAVESAAARRYIELGARYIATHVVHFMSTGSRQFIKEVRE